MAQEKGEDRRAYRRLDARVDVSMTFLPPGGQAAINRDFHSMDLSAGGIRVETDAEVEQGSFVALHIALPGRPDPVDLFAKVVWCSAGTEGRFMMGLQFLGGSRDSLEALEGYLVPLLS